MAKISLFRCDICLAVTPRVFELQPRITKMVIVGEKIQSIPVENGTIYEVCSEECAIKVLRKVGKNIFHTEKVVKKTGKNHD